MIRISECVAPSDRWLPSKRPFAQLTYNQLHPISFSFFSSCAEIFRNILKFAGKFCQRIYGTEAASNEQLAIICPIIQNRETISIN